MPRSLRIRHIQTKLPAIETRHVYIVNTYKVYNNKNSNELRTYKSGSRGWGWGVEGYQYCQSSQLKLKNRRLKSNNKSNKTLIIIIITAKEINTIYVAQLIEHLISVYMPVSIMRLRCHDLLKMTKYMFGALTKHFVKANTCCLLRHRKVNSIKLKRDG